MEEITRANASSRPDDLQLRVLVTPGQTYEGSNLLLAKVRFSGTFELLTSAWEKLLGYACHEIAGKTLRQLMGFEEPVPIAAVAAILDERNPAPVDLKLCCRNGQIKSLRLHRRFAPDERAVYILAEVTGDQAPDDRPPTRG
jgi:PAS domain-containing protein